jgi:hypothetical protein
MIKHIKKYAIIFCLSSTVTLTTQSYINATTQENIELITAILRGPAAYYEAKIAHDTSRSACIKRTIINAIRLTNDISTNAAPGFYAILDLSALCYNLSRGLMTNKKTAAASTTDNDHNAIRQFILPTLEMLGALARAEKITPSLHHIHCGRQALARTSLDLIRIAQCYYANKQKDPLQQKALTNAVIIACAMAVLTELCTYETENTQRRWYKERQEEEQARLEEEQRQREEEQREYARRQQEKAVEERKEAELYHQYEPEIEREEKEADDRRRAKVKELAPLNPLASSESRFFAQCETCGQKNNLTHLPCGHLFCWGCLLRRVSGNNDFCPTCLKK